MNNKIENEEIEVPSTKDMNDRDYLTNILLLEKNMSVNLAIALNEASNKKLYNDIFNIFKDVKKMQRDLYNLMFEKGWYSLEKAEEQKISEKLNDMNNKIEELD